MSNRQYLTPSELVTKQRDLENLAKLELAKRTMQIMGIATYPQLLAKIEEVSSQTREKLQKWVSDPKWIDPLEDLKESLIKAIANLEGVKGTRKQIASLTAQLEKVESVLNGPKEYLPEGMSRKAYAQKISGTPETKRGAKELSPEKKEKLLTALETRFKANMKLHAGVNWNEVKASLESNPEALLSLSKMEFAGHEPDVYGEDENDYYVGTCSEESPKSGRNLNYAEAVEQAETMGITLMTPEHYRDILQEKGKFDSNSWIWLLTQKEVLSIGNALFGVRNRVRVFIDRDNADNLGNAGAWRGSLMVKKS